MSIETDLKISGKLAQFGKRMIAEVSAKLIDQFVDCIEKQVMSTPEQPVEPTSALDAVTRLRRRC